jgi:hypothetical protein
LCNAAYDELLTQEFNPETEDFDGDAGSDGERDELCEAVKTGMLLVFFILIFSFHVWIHSYNC